MRIANDPAASTVEAARRLTSAVSVSRRAGSLLVMIAALAACVPTAQRTAEPATPVPPAPRAAAARPLPHPVRPPASFAHAIQSGTRTATGEPGPRYWQQWARYRLSARVNTTEKRLDGSGLITYLNRSPDTLLTVHFELAQNIHAPGAIRNTPEEVTGGVTLARVTAAGETLSGEGADRRYLVEGTRLVVALRRPLLPGDSVVIGIDWSFRIPQAGASGRMGWDSDNLFFLAYWYPQLAVYDDVGGWHPDPFLGTSEFYAGFADYELTVDAPAGWVVSATGRLLNPDETLAPAVAERVRRAESSDSVVAVLTAGDTGSRATRSGTGGRLLWRFQATSVRDVAFGLTNRSLWDAVRAPVGDRDRDGRPDNTRVDAIYRPSAPRWREAARYGRHSIDFLSRYTGYPYPWPHMTAIEASAIIGGGMEYPMMTLIGDYNAAGDSALYYVTAHELAHMWIPMIVSTDERRHAWIDEGSTSLAENQARKEFFPGRNHDLADQHSYISVARAGLEGEIMRHSNFHYNDIAYGTASYPKPASVLVALRGVLGEETFGRAYRAFISRWAYKHPTPWDFFNTFESISGRDLDWFWSAWYFETWTFDQAIASVSADANGTRITVEDRGLAPMPVHLTVTFANGDTLRRDLPVDVWLGGATSTTTLIPAGRAVQRVEIDAAQAFPDVDRSNNTWTR